MVTGCKLTPWQQPARTAGEQGRPLHAAQLPPAARQIMRASERTWILVKGKVASFTLAVSAMMAHPLLYGTCSPARAPSSVRSTACRQDALDLVSHRRSTVSSVVLIEGSHTWWHVRVCRVALGRLQHCLISRWCSNSSDSTYKKGCAAAQPHNQVPFSSEQ